MVRKYGSSTSQQLTEWLQGEVESKGFWTKDAEFPYYKTALKIAIQVGLTGHDAEDGVMTALQELLYDKEGNDGSLFAKYDGSVPFEKFFTVIFSNRLKNLARDANRSKRYIPKVSITKDSESGGVREDQLEGRTSPDSDEEQHYNKLSNDIRGFLSQRRFPDLMVKLYDLTLDHQSPQEISDLLTAENFDEPSGGREWTGNIVSKYLFLMRKYVRQYIDTAEADVELKYGVGSMDRAKQNRKLEQKHFWTNPETMETVQVKILKKFTFSTRIELEDGTQKLVKNSDVS